MTEILDWTNAPLTPRFDKLTHDLLFDEQLMFVEHPEYFRLYDVVRIGDEDTFTCPECGCTRSRNETVMIIGRDGDGYKVQRALGRNSARTARAGEPVMVVSTATSEQPEEDEET